MRAVKNFIKEQLVRAAGTFRTFPVESVTGFDLGPDLRMLVPKRIP